MTRQLRTDKYGSKIDRLNLGAVIVNLRKTSTLKETADHINNYYMQNGETITSEAIRKWEKKNNVVQEQAVIPIGVPINTYQKVIANHNRSVAQLSRLDSEIYKVRNSVLSEEEEEYLKKIMKGEGIPPNFKAKLEDIITWNRSGTMTSLLGLYNTAIANDHKIALDMVKIEKEMFNVNNQKTLIDAIIKAVVEVDKELAERDSNLSKEFNVAIPTYSLKQKYYSILQSNPNIWKEIQKKG